MIDVILNRNRDMISLLSEVVSDYEEFDGHILPETYVKLKEFFGEEVSEEFREKIRELDI